MKQIFKYGSMCLLLAATSALQISCSDDDATSELNEAIYPESVGLVIPESVEQYIYTDATGVSTLPLIKGEQVQLGYTMAPDNVTYDDVAWSTTDATIVTVDEDGLASAVNGNGYAIVQVAPSVFYSGSGIYSTLKIEVDNELIPATSVTIDTEAYQVYAGETLQLSATILPEDATYRTLQWTSSDTSIATVDNSGLVTGVVNDDIEASVTITATSLDGAQVYASKEIVVMQIVEPEDITIDQTYSVDNGYYCAIADKTLSLSYTTVPALCTNSLIEWTSSDETIATVSGGVVTFNQSGVFGDFTITATCPETGKTSSIKLNLAAGLIRELFHDENNYTWYNASQSGNGTSSSHEWHYGYMTITTYTQNSTKQRGDFKCWESTSWLHAGNYPIFAIRMDDVKDLYDGVTARNITLDAAGTCDGTTFSGGLNGNNNKWLYDYKCSDGSHVFIYDLTQQKWATGGILPTTSVAAFRTLQFKYADIATATSQLTYNVYWVQSFKTLADLQAYIASEGLTYEEQ
ncbi:MAG: DUF4979 domain-containing protein [Bacteroides sp.]|nr:DUF4979 domain-containing protein [Bacteroides sp.]